MCRSAGARCTSDNHNEPWMTGLMTNEEGPHNRGGIAYQGSGSGTLAICGDPVVGRALVLLLRGSGYDTRFLPTSSLIEPGSLDGVGLLLLGPPQLSAEHREALLASLAETPGIREIPVLEMVTASEETREGVAWHGSWRTVPWPNRTEELERQIQAILHANSRTGPDTYQDSRTQEEKKEDGA